MGIKKELGLKIKRMRSKLGLTQEELAEKINVSQRTLSGIEIGENFLTAETLDKIIEALNTTPEELFRISHLKETDKLVDEITNEIEILTKDKKKLENIYKYIKLYQILTHGSYRMIDIMIRSKLLYI